MIFRTKASLRAENAEIRRRFDTMVRINTEVINVGKDLAWRISKLRALTVEAERVNRIFYKVPTAPTMVTTLAVLAIINSRAPRE